eukprot:3119987-Amphidinium_carterae.2
MNRACKKKPRAVMRGLPCRMTKMSPASRRCDSHRRPSERRCPDGPSAYAVISFAHTLQNFSTLCTQQHSADS